MSLCSQNAPEWIGTAHFNEVLFVNAHYPRLQVDAKA